MELNHNHDDHEDEECEAFSTTTVDNEPEEAYEGRPLKPRRTLSC